MLGSILTVAIQLVGWLLKRAQIKGELLQQFYAWAEKLGADQGSAKLRKWSFTQSEWLKNNPWKETK